MTRVLTRIVSRFRGESENYEMNLLLDYNNEVFSVGISDKFTLALATTLDLDGTSSSKISEKDQYYDPLIGTEEKPSLLDRYDYVMHGKVYKFKTQNDEKRYDKRETFLTLLDPFMSAMEDY